MTQVTQVTDHGGGVHSIKVPIPDNPLGHTLVHLVDTDRGPVLIDTGWDDPASWDTLVAGLATLGTSVADVHGVVITHHHPDHHGLSGQVREASGAWIAMHEADTAIVRRTREAEPGTWLGYLARKLAAVGAPDDHLAPLLAARGRGRLRTLPGLRAALPDREIVPGELLDLAGRRLRAVWTPGHTPGHVCLHLEERHPAGLAGRTGGCSPVTICCRASVRTSGCTRTPTTPRSPIRSGTTSPRWSGSGGSGWPRCCPPTSTRSPMRAGAYRSCWTTTRNG
ncbi:hypothetical protein SMICM17S_04140 [Streptomyces microflavus]